MMIKIVLLLSGFLILMFPTAYAEENSCVTCHSKDVTENALAAWERGSYKIWAESVHGVNGVACDNCHRGNPQATNQEEAHKGVKNSSDTTSPIYYENLPETCRTCHSQVYDKFTQSKHYQNLKSGRLAPTCTTCHGFHMGIGKVKQEEISKTCRVCHSYQMGVNPSIPWKAIQSLSLAKQLEHKVEETQDLLGLTKTNTPEALKAETDLILIRSILNSSREDWHSFNLPYFYTELQEAKKLAEEAELDAKRAYYKEYGRLPGKEVCGPTALLVLAALTLLIRKRLRE